MRHPFILDRDLLWTDWARNLFFKFLISKNLLKHEDQVVFPNAYTIHEHLATEPHVFQRANLLGGANILRLSFDDFTSANIDSVNEQIFQLGALSELKRLLIQYLLVVSL